MLTFRLGTSAGENIASNLAPRIFEVCGGRDRSGFGRALKKLAWCITNRCTMQEARPTA
jgi:hypothetical protein